MYICSYKQKGDIMCKICTKCKKDKEITQFYEYTHSNGKKYRKSVCKSCFDLLAKPYMKVYLSKQEIKDKLNNRRRELNKLDKNKLIKAAIARKSLENNIEQNMISRARRRAKLNNLEFSITKEDIIIPKYCHLLEIPIFLGTKKNYKSSPSIDRIDPLKGYTKDNIRVISMLANTMKNCASKQMLESFSKNIMNYLNNNDIVRTIENIESIESEDKELQR